MTRILLALAALSLAASTASAAMPVAECSARYFAAQRDGSLNGRDWDSFRQNVCDSATDRTHSSLHRATDLGAPPAAAR
jgi:hypothetical protein